MHIPAYSSIIKLISNKSSQFQPMPAYSIQFQPIPAYSSLFQPIPAYSSLFHTFTAIYSQFSHSSHLQPSFHHSIIPSFHQPSFHHSIIPSSRHPTIPLFHHSIILFIAIPRAMLDCSTFLISGQRCNQPTTEQPPKYKASLDFQSFERLGDAGKSRVWQYISSKGTQLLKVRSKNYNIEIMTLQCFHK